MNASVSGVRRPLRVVPPAGPGLPYNVESLERVREAKPIRAAVDWLEVAFRVEVDPDVALVLGAARVRARKHGRSELELWRDSPLRGRWRECWTAEAREVGRDKLILTTPRVVVVYEERAPGTVDAAGGEATSVGWNLVVKASNALLQREGIRQAIHEAWTTAERFGGVRDGRLRRADLALDLVGFDFDPMTGDVERIVKRSRSKLKPYTVHGEQYELFREAEPVCDDGENGRSVLHLLGTRFEGISVSPGAAISARIYDKTQELRVKGDDEKREVLRAAWLAAGWTGQRVDRVEFQVRGKALDELGMRGAKESDLLPHFETLWKYLTRQWLRLVNLSTHRRRCLCANDARWDVVQGVEFTDARLAVAGKVKRVRRTFGAMAAQAMGSVLSTIARSGEMPDAFGKVETGDGEVLGAEEQAKYLREEDAAYFLASALGAVYRKGGELAYRAMRAKHATANEALVHFMVRYRAAHARLARLEALPSVATREKGDPRKMRGRMLPEAGQQRLVRNAS